jgi:hypothetical protein
VTYRGSGRRREAPIVLSAVGSEMNLDWVDLDKGRDRWWAVVNTGMNIRVNKIWGISCIAGELVACQDGPYCVGCGLQKVGRCVMCGSVLKELDCVFVRNENLTFGRPCYTAVDMRCLSVTQQSSG